MSRNQSRVSRRDFARFLALSGSVFLPKPLLAWPAPLQQTPGHPDEKFWLSVRQQFLMPPETRGPERREPVSVPGAGARGHVSQYERHGW
jgi:hypothetical protein